MNSADWLHLSPLNALHVPQITRIRWHEPREGEPPDVATVYLADDRAYLVNRPDEVTALRAWQAGTESEAQRRTGIYKQAAIDLILACDRYELAIGTAQGLAGLPECFEGEVIPKVAPAREIVGRVHRRLATVVGEEAPVA